MEAKESLYKASPEEYGSEYKSHLLERYKLYVEMTDKISARRQSANSFLLSINTALLAFLGLVTNNSLHSTTPWLFVVAGSGIIMCYFWYRLVRSYRDINDGRFDVIHAIESQLPLAPYDAEWVRLGKGENPKLYLPFTHVEIRIPWVFASLYALLVILTLLC